MNAKLLGKVDDADTYIDIAIKRAHKDARALRGQKINRNRFQKSKTIELTKIRIFTESIKHSFSTIIKSFPSVDSATEFYYELIECTIGAKELKKALGAVNWALQNTKKLNKTYNSKLKKCNEMTDINKLRTEFYGRACSTIKQIKKELKFLENARKTLKNFPSIKEKHFTIALFGFPNVGKTTLLYKLTGSKPEISNYSFTTKSINVAYFKAKDEKIQVLDTPGTLNRFDKMNYIERQAHLALKYCANLIVYVFDPTEAYPLVDQKELLKSIERFDRDTLIFVSKSDLVEDSPLYKENFITDIEELKEKISKIANS